MFKATDGYTFISSSRKDDLNVFVLSQWDEVETPDGMVKAYTIQNGDKLLLSETNDDTKSEVTITSVVIEKNLIHLYY